jgi:hypothetical protein
MSSKLAADRLQNAAPGKPVKVWIYSAFEKEHWVARSPGDMTHAEHPGTAIQVGNDLYEIVVAEATVEPGYVVRYGLNAWDNRHAVRRTVPYTVETQAQLAEDHLEEVHRQALRKRIVWLFFLAGMAPDYLQRKWEMETVLNMAVVSAASALTNFSIFLTLEAMFGSQMTLAEYSGQAAPHPHLVPLMDYLFLDSMIRLIWIAVSGRPHSTMIVALPSLLWEALARPDKRDQKKENLKLVLEGDEVIRRPASGHLTVRSMLFDDLLAGTAPILYEGDTYIPLHWHEEEKGLKRRWVYEFEKIDPDPKRRYPEYTRPRTSEQQKLVEENTQRRDRVHILAMLWGTYSLEEQLRLQTKYQFQAVRWTAITAAFFMAGAILQVWATYLFGKSIVFYVFAGYFGLESIYRLYRSKGQGFPAGSIVGLFLSFFVSPPQ